MGLGDEGRASNTEAAAILQGSYQSGSHLFSIRGATISDLYAAGTYDVGVPYGRAEQTGPLHLSASAGLAYVEFHHDLRGCGGGTGLSFTRSCAKVAVPIALEGSLRSSKVGLGLSRPPPNP